MNDAAKTAIAPALAAAAEAVEPEQLTLLPPSRFQPGQARHERMVEAVRRDHAGRPPGARNLATRQMLDFVRKTLGDPVLDRARWLQHTPETLARELGCTPLEAFDRLDRIRAELTKLFYAPLAPVDGQGNAVVPFFGLSIGGVAQGGDGRPPWEYLDITPDKEMQQNQALAKGGETPPHDEAPHEEGKCR